MSRCGYQVPLNSCCIVQAPNTRLLQKREECLWTSYSPPFACSDSAPSAHVQPHPHPLWHCPDMVPREQSPGPSPGFPQLELCRAGGWTVASLFVVPYLCTSPHILGQHLISNLLPVLSCGGYTGGKILNTIHPLLGNFSRSCFKRLYGFLEGAGHSVVVKDFWNKKFMLYRSTVQAVGRVWAWVGAHGPCQPWAAGMSLPWCKPGKSSSDLLPSKWIHEDLFAAFSVLILMGFFTSISQNQGVV